MAFPDARPLLQRASGEQHESRAPGERPTSRCVSIRSTSWNPPSSSVGGLGQCAPPGWPLGLGTRATRCTLSPGMLLVAPSYRRRVSSCARPHVPLPLPTAVDAAAEWRRRSATVSTVARGVASRVATMRCRSRRSISSSRILPIPRRPPWTSPRQGPRWVTRPRGRPSATRLDRQHRGGETPHPCQPAPPSDAPRGKGGGHRPGPDGGWAKRRHGAAPNAPRGRTTPKRARMRTDLTLVRRKSSLRDSALGLFKSRVLALGPRGPPDAGSGS